VQDDLTAKLLGADGLPTYAVYLPAISNFFAGYIGRQKYKTRGYIQDERVPAAFERGVEGLNWMSKAEGYFYYKHNLYSAGHANLDTSKHSIKEAMIRERNRTDSWLLGDSGGFQIGKGVWQADWKDPHCAAALAKRKEVLAWMDAYMDYGMILDIPAWVRKTERGRAASGISTFDEAIQATSINNEYFMRNRTGACKFLNVMQGGNHKESEDWYQRMKKFCDPKQYESPFNGWACGSQIACDPHLTLKRLITCRFDGLLEPGLHDWIHVLGNSDMEWVLLLSDMQRAIRKYHNPKLTISYDCASPFVATVHGQLYNDIIGDNPKHWRFPNEWAIDDKKYANDNRSFKDVAEQDEHFARFVDSPISSRLKISDICVYSSGDLNKLGKVSKNSWDSFSYALQMAHNVWMHTETTQEANRRYDAGLYPSVMTTATSGRKSTLYFDRLYCSDIINDIWETSDCGKAMKLIDHYSSYWMNFRGVRGNFGPKAKNSLTAFDHIFQEA
jgi:hypothetical protein